MNPRGKIQTGENKTLFHSPSHINMALHYASRAAGSRDVIGMHENAFYKSPLQKMHAVCNTLMS